MSDELFGIAKSVSPDNEVKELLDFLNKIDWNYIKEKILTGDLDDKVRVAMISPEFESFLCRESLKEDFEKSYIAFVEKHSGSSMNISNLINQSNMPQQKEK